jgi:hypothetical protein
MTLCDYPAGGELSLSVCVAASSALNRSGAVLVANDLTGCLEQISGCVETQLQYMRTAHHTGLESQPFVEQLCATLKSVGNGIPEALSQNVAASVVQELCTAISACAVAGPGPVDSCCLFALKVADDAYSQYVVVGPPTVSFAIRPADSDLSWHGVQSKIAGMTTLRGRPTVTSVDLVLSLRLPWHAALDAIPYVLVHECVAHAFRGPRDSTEDTGQGSEFAEGWMDRVAVLLLLRAVKAGAAFALPWPWSTVQDIDQRLASAYMERRALRNPDPHARLRSKWDIGVEAALALQGSINRILGDDRLGAEEEFLRLSLVLNASNVSPDARDRLARRLYFARASDLQSDVGAWLTDGLPPPHLLHD